MQIVRLCRPKTNICFFAWGLLLLLACFSTGCNDKEAKPSAPDSIWAAAMNGDEKRMNELLRQGADINQKHPKSMETPLHFAVAYSKNHDFIRFLLKSGAKTDLLESHGYSPLFFAIHVKDPIAAEILLQNGAKTDIQGKKNGLSPLHFAVADGQIEIVKLLISHGANINLKAINGGLSPLHLAISNKNQILVKYLIENGADLEQREEYSGYTPVQFAARKGFADMVALLIELGAKPETQAIKDFPDAVKMIEEAREKN